MKEILRVVQFDNVQMAQFFSEKNKIHHWIPEPPEVEILTADDGITGLTGDDGTTPLTGEV